MSAEIDYEALAKAAHEGYWGEEIKSDLWDIAEIQRGWDTTARTVVAAYTAQLRDQGFAVVLRSDLNTMYGLVSDCLNDEDEGWREKCHPSLIVELDRIGAAVVAAPGNDEGGTDG